MAGIYVHLPFCPYICPYCDFAKWPYRRSEAQRYLRALHCEIERAPSQPAQTVYLGGGTPNTYDPNEIAELLCHIRERFPQSHPEPAKDRERIAERPRANARGFLETTIELNPELVTAGDLAAYVASGMTRVSIGVQSFIAGEIRTLGRGHAPEDVARAVRAARGAGVRSISCDLMFGVPGQTLSSWRESLEAAVSLDIDHISTYGLTIESGTPYAAWHDREPEAFASDSLEAELYAAAIDRLEAAGFEHYEISNFAKPGHECRHNLNYWTNGEYVGLGVGAASYRDGVRRVNTRNLQEYVRAALDGQDVPSQAEQLAGARRTGEAVMLSLRTSQGVSVGAFKERYGVDFFELYAPVIEEYRAAGLLDVDARGARLTRRGRFLANDVCAAFIAAE